MSAVLKPELPFRRITPRSKHDCWSCGAKLALPPPPNGLCAQCWTWTRMFVRTPHDERWFADPGLFDRLTVTDRQRAVRIKGRRELANLETIFECLDLSDLGSERVWFALRAIRAALDDPQTA